jgi:hypothetical protein
MQERCYSIIIIIIVIIWGPGIHLIVGESCDCYSDPFVILIVIPIL